MKRVFCIMLAFIGSFPLILAQSDVISGHFGKRNMVGLRLNTGLRNNQPEKWSHGLDQGNGFYRRTSVKSELEVSVGRILSDQFHFEVRLGHNNTSVKIGEEDIFERDGKIKINDGYDFIKGHPRIVDVYTGIGVKFFMRNRGAIAPIGTYFGLNANLHSYAVHLTNLVGSYRIPPQYRYDESKYHQLDFGQHTYSIAEFNVAFGRTGAVTNQIIYDMGFSIGAATKASAQFEKDFVGQSTDRFASLMLREMRKYHLAKLYFGLAYMIN